MIAPWSDLKTALQLSFGLALLSNLALVAQALTLAGFVWAAGIRALLVFIEALYSRVRKVNREVAFEQASYGFRDKSVLGGPESLSPADQAKRERLDKKLDQLKAMATEGEISQGAYGEIRDRYRVHWVMEDDRILNARG